MKNPIEHSRQFWCSTCDETLSGDGLSATQMLEHLKTHHKLAEFKGSKSLNMALDFSDCYQNTFEWTIGGVKLIEVSSGPRSGH